MKIAEAQSETTHAGTTWTTTMTAAAVPGSWCEAATPWLPCDVMVASPCVPVWMRRWCFWSVYAPHRRKRAPRQARAAPRVQPGELRARFTLGVTRACGARNQADTVDSDRVRLCRGGRSRT